jgi:hypothetical protein
MPRPALNAPTGCRLSTTGAGVHLLFCDFIGREKLLCGLLLTGALRVQALKFGERFLLLCGIPQHAFDLRKTPPRYFLLPIERDCFLHVRQSQIRLLQGYECCGESEVCLFEIRMPIDCLLEVLLGIFQVARVAIYFRKFVGRHWRLRDRPATPQQILLPLREHLLPSRFSALARLACALCGSG